MFTQNDFGKWQGVVKRLCVGAMFTAVSSVAFATGSVDQSFGSGGVAKYTVPNGGAGIMDAVMLPDDRLIIGGSGFNNQNSMTFARFLKNGVLDTSFGGGNGYVAYSPPDVLIMIVEGFSVDTDLNMYAVGHGGAVSDDAYIYKLDRYGSIDTSFSNSGMYLHSSHPRLPANTDTEFTAVAVQPDGKVVVAGKSQSFNVGSFLLRLNSNGTPDTSFGLMGDGLVLVGQLPITPSTISSTNLGSVKVLDSGEIVVGGFVQNAGWGSFVARYTTNGLLDTTFNGTGVNMIANGGWGADWAGFIEVDRLGQTYLLSRVTLSGYFDRCVVTKFGKNGQMDASWGTNGQTWIIPPAGDHYNCGSLAQSGEGGLAIAIQGNHPLGGTYNGPAIVARLDSLGNLDQNFGTQGVASVWNPYIVNSTYLEGLFNHTFVEPQSDGSLVWAIGEYQMNGVGYTLGRLNDFGNRFTIAPTSGFADKGMQPAYSWVSSNIIQVQNLNNNVAIKVQIDNGEYSINGTPYTSAPGWIFNNDLINVRNQTGAAPGFVAITTLTLGGDHDRKNAGLIRGEQMELEFLISTDPIAIDPIDPEPGPLEPFNP